jgi:hypothetical protein
MIGITIFILLALPWAVCNLVIMFLSQAIGIDLLRYMQLIDSRTIFKVVWRFFGINTAIE